MKKLVIAILVLIIAMLSIACDDGTFVCQECGKTIELNHETDGDGNSYICKDCSYEQGYIDGYNYLVDLIDYGKIRELERAEEIDDIPFPTTEDGEIDWDFIKERAINKFRDRYERNLEKNSKE